jgi:protein-L-isoaspartate(D-aspartate) O-methyltransferase
MFSGKSGTPAEVRLTTAVRSDRYSPKEVRDAEKLVFRSADFFWIFLSSEGTKSDNPPSPVQVDSHSMKEEMIENQIRTRGIKNEVVLNAIRKVDRHKFVPEEIRHHAYSDRPLPIGEGQTISQPYIVALMTELLELKNGDRVLEVGTGSGYQAAILAELADHVYTIEIIGSLALSAERLLRELGYRNINVKIGDGYIGWEEFAPFDAIIVTAAPPHIPQPLLDQLKEGGRLVIPVGDYYQELKKITKVKGKIRSQNVIPVVFVPMTGEHVKTGGKR